MLKALTATLFICALAACNPNAPTCLPGPPSPQKCPPGVFIDASGGDPTCHDEAGDPICRGGATACYVCAGPRFTDGCLASSVGTYQCVHSCSKC